MNKILELRQKRARVWNDAKKYLDEHRGKDGILSEDDEAVYERLEGVVVLLGKEIERLERQAAIDRVVDTPMPWEHEISEAEAIDALQKHGWVQCTYNCEPFAVVKHKVKGENDDKRRVDFLL